MVKMYIDPQGHTTYSGVKNVYTILCIVFMRAVFYGMR